MIILNTKIIQIIKIQKMKKMIVLNYQIMKKMIFHILIIKNKLDQQMLFFFFFMLFFFFFYFFFFFFFLFIFLGFFLFCFFFFFFFFLFISGEYSEQRRDISSENISQILAWNHFRFSSLFIFLDSLGFIFFNQLIVFFFFKVFLKR